MNDGGMARQTGLRQQKLQRQAAQRTHFVEVIVDAKIKFPSLVFCRGHVSFAPDLDFLTRARKPAIRKVLYKDSFIVDSEGMKYQVKDVREVGGIPPFWGWRIFLVREIRVDLTFDDGQQLSLEEVKQLVREAVNKGRDFWDARIEGVRGIKRRVKAANNFDEVIAVFRW
ncbi:MAG: hypothetical protein ACREAB_18025 [Blastocatellia bacterium]